MKKKYLFIGVLIAMLGVTMTGCYERREFGERNYHHREYRHHDRNHHEHHDGRYDNERG